MCFVRNFIEKDFLWIWGRSRLLVIAFTLVTNPFLCSSVYPVLWSSMCHLPGNISVITVITKTIQSCVNIPGESHHLPPAGQYHKDETGCKIIIRQPNKICSGINWFGLCRHQYGHPASESRWPAIKPPGWMSRDPRNTHARPCSPVSLVVYLKINQNQLRGTLSNLMVFNYVVF